MFLFATSLAFAQDPIPQEQDTTVVQTTPVIAPTSFADRISRQRSNSVGFSIGATETYGSEFQASAGPLRATTLMPSIFAATHGSRWGLSFNYSLGLTKYNNTSSSHATHSAST